MIKYKVKNKKFILLFLIILINNNNAMEQGDEKSFSSIIADKKIKMPYDDGSLEAQKTIYEYYNNKINILKLLQFTIEHDKTFFSILNQYCPTTFYIMEGYLLNLDCNEKIKQKYTNKEPISMFYENKWLPLSLKEKKQILDFAIKQNEERRDHPNRYGFGQTFGQIPNN